MNIIKTKVPDINADNLEQEKSQLSEKILDLVRPLLEEMEQEKGSILQENQELLKTKKEEILKNKVILEELMKEVEKKKKVKKILERIDKLSKVGLVNDARMKNDMIVMISNIDEMDEKALDGQLELTMKLISKRFSK